MSNQHIESNNDDVDKLHIPHIGFLQWVTNDGVTIKNSMNDKSLRKIGIRFYLEDLRAGTNWVHIKSEQDLSISIPYNKDKIDVWFEKNDANLLHSILIELESTGCIEAFRKVTTYIFLILSSLCFFYRRPLKINKV
ncbi:MAG: hypothetical protein ACK4PR_06795, partial [Gammaproteobacteria bacterium]